MSRREQNIEKENSAALTNNTETTEHLNEMSNKSTERRARRSRSRSPARPSSDESNDRIRKRSRSPSKEINDKNEPNLNDIEKNPTENPISEVGNINRNDEIMDKTIEKNNENEQQKTQNELKNIPLNEKSKETVPIVNGASEKTKISSDESEIMPKEPNPSKGPRDSQINEQSNEIKTG